LWELLVDSCDNFYYIKTAPHAKGAKSLKVSLQFTLFYATGLKKVRLFNFIFVPGFMTAPVIHNPIAVATDAMRRM